MIVKMFILLYSRSLMMACGVLARLVYPAINSVNSTEASTCKSLSSPPPISPIAASSEEQKDHEDNKNEIHIFLQNTWRRISLLHMWVQNSDSPASDSTYSGQQDQRRKLPRWRGWLAAPWLK